MDPENLFIDNDDEIDRDYGFIFKDGDEDEHVKMDVRIKESVLQNERQEPRRQQGRHS
jgi:hypothetical protein